MIRVSLCTTQRPCPAWGAAFFFVGGAMRTLALVEAQIAVKTLQLRRYWRDRQRHPAQPPARASRLRAMRLVRQLDALYAEKRRLAALDACHGTPLVQTVGGRWVTAPVHMAGHEDSGIRQGYRNLAAAILRDAMTERDLPDWRVAELCCALVEIDPQTYRERVAARAGN